jgi:beta-lactam-binding protein with PASTA domain
MSYFKFIKTKGFFIHASLAILTAVLLFWLGFKMAASYTEHNITVQVPDFTGKPIAELNDFIKDKKLRYQVIDSIYSPQQTPGTIIRQDPEKESVVKENRVVYLYVTSMLPPQIEMPKLVDRSVRQAIAMVESYGLKANIKYVADACKNCVLKQLYKGKEIAAGTPVKKGSVIELQVGKGNGNTETVALPDLLGLKFCDARNKLQSSSLQVGNVLADKTVSDSCAAIVYRQTPAAGSNKEIGTGGKVDLYITTDKNKLELLKNTENENTE